MTQYSKYFDSQKKILPASSSVFSNKLVNVPGKLEIEFDTISERFNECIKMESVRNFVFPLHPEDLLLATSDEKFNVKDELELDSYADAIVNKLLDSIPPH